MPIQSILEDTEQPISKYNALSIVKEIAQSSTSISKLESVMSIDQHILKEGLDIPNPEQLLEYFRRADIGLSYSSSTYGEGAMPQKIIFSPDFENKGRRLSNLIAYVPQEDAVCVTYLQIAEEAGEYSTSNQTYLFSYGRLPQEILLKREDITILKWIEESYHRHQIKIQGKKSEDTIGKDESTLEQEITSVLLKAIEDLNIHTYRYKQG